MIVHDSAFETLAKMPVKSGVNVTVIRQVFDEDGNYTDITPAYASSDDLMSVNIDAVGKMFGTATKKATVKLLGVHEDVAADDVFQIRLGLDTGSGYNYVSQGLYAVDSVDVNYDAGSTTIVMYDSMWKATNTLYSEAVVESAVEYPITVEGYASYVADVLNLEMDSEFYLLPNADFQITQDLYININGATLQNVIQDIAGATGTTARVTDNKLVFSQYSVASDNLDSDTLKTLKIGRTYGPITSVILGRAPQNDNVAIYSTVPTPNIITGVNSSTDTFTLNEHEMIDGNMVQLTSTGTLPAPLVANKSYYVAASTANTFKLAASYLDAVATTDVINITSSGTGTLQIAPLATKEIQIINNQIVDGTRQDRLPPLYDRLSGIDWSAVKADTTGLGWYEVGDVISFTQGSNTVRAFLTEVHLVLSGSVKESLVSEVPELATINYQAAGGVMKTIYNTEIKVDKQANEITSIVAQQNAFQDGVMEDFTEIRQDIDDISLTVQKAGGGNLLLNSVGFATEAAEDDDGVNYQKLRFWDYPPTYAIADNGSVTSSDSSESQNFGGISGRLIQMSSDFGAGESVYITQRVNVAVNTPLSFGLRVRNVIGTGSATITLSNTNDTFTITIPNTTDYQWQEFRLDNFLSTMTYLDVKIQASAAAFRFTDLRLLYGTTLQGWVQSNQENLSTNVQFSIDGMRIFDESHDTETRVTYNEFSTRRRNDGAILFEADDTGVVTNDITIKGSTSYKSGDDVVIKQITIPSSSALAGIAFVKGS